jgi:hypothetical protein
VSPQLKQHWTDLRKSSPMGADRKVAIFQAAALIDGVVLARGGAKLAALRGDSEEYSPEQVRLAVFSG